jgi:hypothetical protein
MTSPVNVQFDENKIAEAIMLLCKISVDRELLTVYTPEQVVDAATQVIKQSIHAFINVLKDENHLKSVLMELITKSNLKYLSRELPVMPKIH